MPPFPNTRLVVKDLPVDTGREFTIEDIRRGVDAVLFPSGSTVTHFMNSMRQHAPGFAFPADTRIVCIGPVTAGAARETGLRVDAVAQVYTTEGLVDGLVDVFSKGAVAHGE